MTASIDSTFTRIVVPFDGSANSARVFPSVADLASYHGATIHVITVIDPSRCVPPALAAGATGGVYLSEDEADCLARIRGEANWALSQAHAALEPTGLPLETDLRTGPVVETLLSELRSGDLVVIASHSQSTQRRRYGSVTAALLNEAPVPIVVIPASDHPEDAALATAHDIDGILGERGTP